MELKRIILDFTKVDSSARVIRIKKSKIAEWLSKISTQNLIYATLLRSLIESILKKDRHVQVMADVESGGAVQHLEINLILEIQEE
jgi:hypothetical protein